MNNINQSNDKHGQRVKFATLGCRLNQYETQAIREQFNQAGFEETDHNRAANVFVLNTCTVTGASDRESRYLIRKFHRENPEAQIVVTGCYVERNRDEIENLPGVTLVVLNRQKSEIVHLYERRNGLRSAPTCISETEVGAYCDTPLLSKRHYTPLSISQFEGRSRAYIKIQDGCNHACSFCKVVLVRGPARSRPLAEVIEEAKRLSDQGYQEIVLTGIQLGAYGLDVQKRQMLTDLLEKLSRVEGLRRIRLSSIEPTDVTEELIQAMSQMEKVCPHLHIPLQSGDDEVLKRMNRRYRRHFYLDLIHKLRSRVEDFVLTTDVMVGFPGETDVQFEQTVRLLEAVVPYKLHIFPYSVREGTRAARLTDAAVGSRTVNRRRDALFCLENKLRAEVENAFLGRRLDLIVENHSRRTDWISGRGANYLKVYFRRNQMILDGMIQVMTQRIEGGKLIGSLVDS